MHARVFNQRFIIYDFQYYRCRLVSATNLKYGFRLCSFALDLCRRGTRRCRCCCYHWFHLASILRRITTSWGSDDESEEEWTEKRPHRDNGDWSDLDGRDNKEFVVTVFMSGSCAE